MTMFTTTRRLLTGGLFAVAIMAGFATAPAAAQGTAPANLIDTIKRRGKLIVGMASFVPWAMRDTKNDWIGFEIDVAKKLAADLEVELELVPTAWDGIVPALLASRFDTIIGGLSITTPRALQVNFTVPYSQSGTGVAASKQLAANLKWPEGYDATNVTFACRRGTVACKWIETKFPKATLRQFDDTAVVYQEVVNGNAHAAITSEPAPTFAVIQNGERLFKPTDNFLTTSVEGFAVRKGDADALAFFNAWITANRDSGWLQERRDYWFKSRAWADQVKQ